MKNPLNLKNKMDQLKKKSACCFKTEALLQEG